MSHHIDEAQLAEFLDEARQNLTTLEEGLQAADSTGRRSHTRDFSRSTFDKGLAGMLGLEEICRLTHDLETVFDAIRNDKHASRHLSAQALWRRSIP